MTCTCQCASNRLLAQPPAASPPAPPHPSAVKQAQANPLPQGSTCQLKASLHMPLKLHKRWRCRRKRSLGA